ncbi:MAG: DNA mismatch repair protein MutS [Clostridia bacterium]|jgi:DNA mismatch repair protein MutS|nr:DNA mismatch repair protein MutS [Clostridia bacterium]MCI2000369.1 DNA mismatch repair protein MutS [Clostridia bacterium]MCI2015549.1 DNA mismatch repair protein MutS [Clostridia bacterium]
MAKISPMMEQYMEIKNRYKYCLLFFRIGDFYEMFYDDALIASKELEIVLTGKNCGQEERAPMCGVPFHSADSYIKKLVSKGYKVAICEQVEDPKLAKGLVKREVIRIITPGTIVDNTALDEKKNNYIMCIYADKSGFGMSVCDVTTGEFLTTDFVSVNAVSKIIDETAKFMPSELIANEGFKSMPQSAEIEKRFNLKIGTCDDWMFEYNTANKTLCRHFGVQNLDGMGLKNHMFSVSSAGCLMQYLYDMQKNNLSNILNLKYYTTGQFMFLDMASRRNLELTETLREKNKKGSLLWVLDKTKTAMGARLIRKWIEQPLIDKDEINKRLSSVKELLDNFFMREQIKEIINSMHDFERITGKITYQSANAKDLYALKCSIENLPLLKATLSKSQSPYLKEIYENLDTLEDVSNLIENSIIEDAPFTVREGGMIKEGYNNELDALLKAKTEGRKWLNDLEEKEKEATGIKNLRIRFNKVFGYYIEVTKSNISDVPERYIRKQTLTNAERYTTEELTNLAELIMGSEEKSVELEYKIFCQIRDRVSAQVERIHKTASLTAIIDVLQSFSEVAAAQNYVCPEVDDSDIIDIKEGRHPVVEKMLDESFIPNDTYLDEDENRLLIITGPNMAGKSTFMRQTALIVLMAQIGSFVPASSAKIGVVDRIFTRVGASDDLASGQSTFMIEMTEVANILNNATKNSLLILDEIGRGTSTFDGLSIAWSVLEYITDKKLIGAKTLFATHYHEITELEGKLSGVKNYCITVQEHDDDIVFLRKIVRGGADNSYGIQVGKLAGLPKKVISRAHEILRQLNTADITKKAKKISKQSEEESNSIPQMDMFSMKETQIIDEINKIDVMKLTPIEALQTLYNLQNKTKGM